MCACSSFPRLQQQRARSISKEAASGLDSVLRDVSTEALSKFRNEVIMPAIVLATKIRCSTTHYYYDFTKISAIQSQDLHAVQLRDVESGKRIPSGHKYISDTTGTICQALLTIQPALYRRRPGMESVVLRPAILLAKLTDQSMPQDNPV